MRFCHFELLVLAGLLLCPGFFSARAQDCPNNIDFETGTFNGWTCYIGSSAAVNGQNVIYLSPTPGPIPNRQTMYSRSSLGALDEYGGFPVNCPNGSGYSVRLGNNIAGTEAEGLSYEFTIPANQNIYSLIYHYAVVFQDPNHEIYQQPRLVIQITNVTDNSLIPQSKWRYTCLVQRLVGCFH